MNLEHQIKVLVVEAFNAVRMSMVHLLNSDSRIVVIGAARNGREALQFLSRRRPDVILIDIQMPQIDGLEVTRRIMETQPVPIIICNGDPGPCDASIAAKLLEAGAVALVDGPMGAAPKDFQTSADHLLQTLKLMSEVKVVHRWPRARPNSVGAPILRPPPLVPCRECIQFVGIGASTGGPPVLQTILQGLPRDFPIPILVVQHITPGFLDGLVDWLHRTTGICVHIAQHATSPVPGHVYLAPDDHHMTVDMGGRIVLSREEPCGGLRPSVSHLFFSLANTCGPNAVGVLLSGMGKDGASELKRMRDRGATTIVQDRQTSIVHGMPGEAIALGAAGCVLPADQIAPALLALVHQNTCEQGALT
jgi:two-component system chemotaxis response regulator CheB